MATSKYYTYDSFFCYIEAIPIESITMTIKVDTVTVIDGIPVSHKEDSDFTDYYPPASSTMVTVPSPNPGFVFIYNPVLETWKGVLDIRSLVKTYYNIITGGTVIVNDPYADLTGLTESVPIAGNKYELSTDSWIPDTVRSNRLQLHALGATLFDNFKIEDIILYATPNSEIALLPNVLARKHQLETIVKTYLTGCDPLIDPLELELLPPLYPEIQALP